MTAEKARKRIREWMTWAGLSQADLAERLGLSGSAVSRILGGSRVPCLRTAIAIEREMRQPQDNGRVYQRGVVEVREWERGR
jgi:transcriptional regulator with XRE-family HTH domain